MPNASLDACSITLIYPLVPQFKSVKEEDEETIDEDDVDDQELAQLVAMAMTGLSESEEETESDLDSTDGVRPTTIGTADLSEASTNTPYSVSFHHFVFY